MNRIRKTRVYVVGAGVIGMCTAVRIQETIPECSVTVIADKFNADTLSDGAAGIFRPSDSTRGPDPDVTRRWYSNSYEYYKSLAVNCDGEKTGVREITGRILAEQNPEITQSKILKDILPVWRKMSADEIKEFPGDWNYGSVMKTLIIECRRFLPWMMQRFENNGGVVVNKHINSFYELIKESDVIVNCTGLAAKYLCNDVRVIPIRGQVLRVKAPWIKEFLFGTSDTYIIPGRDNVVLGGTRQFESYNLKINKYNREEILEKCCKLIPSLKNAELEREFVGLRPYRDTVRLELDFLNKNFPIIHNYGHGGNGVTLAWGCAVDAATLVAKGIKINSKSVQSKL